MMPYRTALVTGASSGIGRALAKGLARQGTRVALAARREALLAALAGEIADAGGKALVAPMDVADTEISVRAVQHMDDEMGGLDLVIACAGAGPPDPSAVPYRWHSLAVPFHVNFCGAAATLTAVAERMVERRKGHLVGISSIASFGALPASAAYCAPKAGLSMLLDCLRLDLAASGVAVTAVHLGFVQTPMVVHRTGPMPQLVTPDEAARHILERLGSRPTTIDFPEPLASSAKIAALLPRSLRDRLMRLLGSS